MTADLSLQGEREGKGMDFNQKMGQAGKPPSEPDEGWWAAVLADEPFIVNETEKTPIILPEDMTQEQSERTKPNDTSVNWERARNLFVNDEIIKMNVVGHNRGGILVLEDDIHGFVPASHLIDIPPDISDDDREQYLMSYLDRKIPLKVIECDSGKDRIVFSERAAQAKEGQRKQLLSNLNEGDVVKGTVTNVTSFGAFVDLGGLEGLIHVSELSWGRVSDPSDVINVNDQVEAVVLEVSEEQCRIALSLKRLEDNPWVSLAQKFSPGDALDVTVTSIVKYGAFARLPEGVEGLIHISSMQFPGDCKQIDDFLYEGQSVRVCVLNIDADKRRLGLKLERY